MSNNSAFENKELCAWLEEGLKTILESKSEKICICAVLPSGEIYTGYFDCSNADKAQIAYNIHCDATMEMVLNNIGMISDALDDYNDDEEGLEDCDDGIPFYEED